MNALPTTFDPTTSGDPDNAHPREYVASAEQVVRLRGSRPCRVRQSVPWSLKTAGRFRPLLYQIGYRLEGWNVASPGDLPALRPQDRPRAHGCAGADLHGEPFAGAKELLGDPKAEDGVEACLQGECGVPAGKRADAVARGGLALLALAHDSNGGSHQNEATVGRELTRLRPVLLYS